LGGEKSHVFSLHFVRFPASLGGMAGIWKKRTMFQKCFSTQMTQIEQINADFKTVDNQIYIKTMPVTRVTILIYRRNAYNRK